MNFISEDNFDGLVISKRDDPPIHYIFKIENFSLLSKNSIEKYESSEFESGGYKWKLAFHPNGNKEKGVKDHISLYLVMADTTSLPKGWEVNVNLRLFMLDQKRDKYVTIEGWNSRHFHTLKTEWGFSQLIPRTTFEDPSNGYLVDDTCVFGADVIVLKRATKGECLSMMKDVTPYKHTWRVCGYVKLTTEIYSDVFHVGGKKWKIQLYPMGNLIGEKEGYISIFLRLDDSGESLSHAEKFYVNFKIRMQQQRFALLKELEAGAKWFNAENKSWGWNKYMKLDYFKKEANGFLVNDSCVIEAEVAVLGSVNQFA